MVLPAADAGEEAEPASTSTLSSVDPKTCSGNITILERAGFSSLGFAACDSVSLQLFILSC